MYQANEMRRCRFSSLPKMALFLFWLMGPTWLRSQTISGTIQDPSGAVIAGARIEITGADLAQPVVLVSDGLGAFVSPDLKPGTYSLRVMRDGFEPLARTVDLQGPVQLQLTLAIAQQKVTISVPGKSPGFANSDPVYRQLREIGLGQAFRFDNFTLTWDASTFQFQKGTIIFLKPVNGIVTGAIFIGEGHFSLKPVTLLDARELSRRTGAAEVNEDFTEAVFRFTGEGRTRFFPGLRDQTEPPSEADAVLNHWRERMRQRREIAAGFTEYLLEGERMDNVDADLLAAVYNSSHPEFFNAYLRGKKHKDLRLFVRTGVGALPQLDSPEEVALISFDPEGMNDGVWYLAHLRSEYSKRTASSMEDRRFFATHRYTIETVIAKNGHLFSSANITFQPLVAGERVLKFGLLPNLRVTQVLDERGQDLYYIQESRKQDGSFYVILPEAQPLGKEQSIHIEYTGDKVLEEAGGGNYYVGARTSWYPNLNGFGEKAFYDLTFKVPRKYKVISVGRLQGESIEQDLAVTHWVTPVPVAVAGFNYGEYTKLDPPDEITGYKIWGYYLSELPDNLRGFRALESMAPRNMTKDGYLLDSPDPNP
jgi:carboxypeptidase family protein